MAVAYSPLENNRANLKNLIKKSSLLGDKQKEDLMAMVETATSENLEKALEIFSRESERLEYLKEQEEKFLKIMEKFVENNKANLKKIGKKVIKKIEAKSKAEDSKKIDDLLK